MFPFSFRIEAYLEFDRFKLSHRRQRVPFIVCDVEPMYPSPLSVSLHSEVQFERLYASSIISLIQVKYNLKNIILS